MYKRLGRLIATGLLDKVNYHYDADCDDDDDDEYMSRLCIAILSKHANLPFRMSRVISCTVKEDFKEIFSFKTKALKMSLHGLFIYLISHYWPPCFFRDAHVTS